MAAIKCGVFSTPGATGNQTVTVTGLGVAPKVVILFGDYATSEGVSSDSNLAIGVGISSSSRACIVGSSNDGDATSVARMRHNNAVYFTTLVNGSTTIPMAGDFVSFGLSGSDGQFTINWTTHTSTVRNVYYIAIGGADVLASLVQLQTPTATGSQNYAHGLASAPTAVIMFSAGMSDAPATTVTDAITSIALTDFASSRTIVRAMQHNQADAVAKRMNVSGFGVGFTFSSGIPDIGTPSADGTNVSVNWTTADATARYAWMLCLSGVAAKLGTLTVPTTGTSLPVTGVGFQPLACLFASAMTAASAVVQANGSMMMGADDGTNAVCSGVTDLDASATMRSKSFNDSGDSIERYTTASTPTLAARANISSFGSDGFTLAITPDATTSFDVAYLALATPAVSLTGSPGSFALTGQAATLTAQRKITGSPGSFTLTGQTASLIAARKLTAEAGSLAITGQDATFSTYANLVVTPGSFALTGQSSTLAAQRVLTGQAGSFTLTGLNAGLAAGRALSADSGTYTLSGQAATFRRGYGLSCDPGSYAITGQAAVLTRSLTPTQPGLEYQLDSNRLHYRVEEN